MGGDRGVPGAQRGTLAPRISAMHFWTKRDGPVRSSEVRPSSVRTLESEPEYLQFSQRDRDAANKD